MTILVTGSAGHLGEALKRCLAAQGRAAIGIDIKPSPFTDRVGSIGDPAFVADCMAGITAVIHAATLHKPHVATHAYQDFVDTNVTGTLVLLEAARAAGVGAFVFTSTTSTFGAALSPGAGEPAAWITEDVVPVPKNIYGVTKTAAEGLCELFARKHQLPAIVLRTSRFFPEADDDAEARQLYTPENAQANELLHRRADIADIVDAHLLAVDKAATIGFGRYIISAASSFSRADLMQLRSDAAAVIERHYPESAALFAASGWRLPQALDRVYVSRHAIDELGWRPRHDFSHVLDCLRMGADFRSPLARTIGSKGYHDTVFSEGPYPVG